MFTVPGRYLSRLSVRRRTSTRRRTGLRRWVYGAATGLTSLAVALAMALAAGVARAAPVDGPLGVDVSHPQCGGPLPTGQAFALVGVNGGTATTTNPCLASQLAWAQGSTGATVHDDVQLYVNTGNPGGTGSASWPRSGSNRYGECDGSSSISCAYQYGWDRARDDAMNRGISRPEEYMWWLDVEIANTWDYTDGGTARNVAVLEGMTEYFTSIGVRGVGLYSTRYQWRQIVGDAVGSTSSLNGLSNWRPTGSTLEDARANCGLAPLTPGGRVEMTQFTSDYDYNHSCI